jgi:hypothetical protein
MQPKVSKAKKIDWSKCSQSIVADDTLKKWINEMYIDCIRDGIGYIELPTACSTYNDMKGSNLGDIVEDEYPETAEWLDVIYNDRMVQINEKGKIREKKKGKRV